VNITVQDNNGQNNMLMSTASPEYLELMIQKDK